MTDDDALASADDKLTTVLLRHYRAEKRLKLVIAELKSMASILEDLVVMLREAPEGLCGSSASARLNQCPSTGRLLELVQEARNLKLDLQDLEQEIPPEFAG
jgi:hypothetical protein